MKNISILGSTGSIGTQALEVISKSEDFKVSALTANSNIDLLEKQAREFSPKFIAVGDDEKALELKKRLFGTGITVLNGEDGIISAASESDCDILLTSIVGIAGLKPTMAAIEKNIDIALANKETLVTAGHIVMGEAKKRNLKILPVDSEHSAIFQCIGTHPHNEIEKLIITCSGGSFYGKDSEFIKNASISDALNHPNWSMGKKITIDSATLMNKGLEVIEAHHLFNIDYNNIDVVIHRESIIHSMVEFTDGSILAQMGLPDMKLPIHYALHYPKRQQSDIERIDFTGLSKLTFAKPDTETFRCLNLAFEAGRAGGSMPVVLNASNEVAVDLFLNGKINFGKIADIVYESLENHNNIENPTLEEILHTDKDTRACIYKKYSY